MNATVDHIHPSRRCSNCTHVDAEFECLQLVYIADGSAQPADFACLERQTKAEYSIEVHRPVRPPLGAV